MAARYESESFTVPTASSPQSKGRGMSSRTIHATVPADLPLHTGHLGSHSSPYYCLFYNFRKDLFGSYQQPLGHSVLNTLSGEKYSSFKSLEGIQSQS